MKTIMVICEKCDSPFNSDSSHTRRRKSKYCDNCLGKMDSVLDKKEKIRAEHSKGKHQVELNNYKALIAAITQKKSFNAARHRYGRKVVSLANRKWIFQRDNFTCQYCGSKKDLEIDHKIPVTFGGTNSEDNLITACSKCNSKKGMKRPEVILTRALKNT